MNLYEIANKSGFSLVNLRKLAKLGVLKFDDDDGFVSSVIFHMRANPELSAEKLLTLIERPDYMEDLEIAKPKYAQKARAAIIALGDLSYGLAPMEVAGAIWGASRGNVEDCEEIAHWLSEVLPDRSVRHAWIAVRILKPLNEAMRQQVASQIIPALLNVRKLDDFQFYYESVKISGRPVIRYFQKKDLDL